jgi:hypothetical protein
VTQKTISQWLSNFGTLPKGITAPALPDTATLDAIARQIREQAKSEVRAEVREGDRLAAIRAALQWWWASRAPLTQPQIALRGFLRASASGRIRQA